MGGSTMSDDDPDQQRLRNRAHGRLVDWGQHRDAALAGMGYGAHSATQRMAERLTGGGSSTRPHQLNNVEGYVTRVGKTLAVENAVRALRPKLREAIHARYALDRSMSVWAEEVGISPESARKRVSRGLLEIGFLLDRWRTPDHVDECEVTP